MTSPSATPTVAHDREPHRSGNADFGNGHEHSYDIVGTDEAADPVATCRRSQTFIMRRPQVTWMRATPANKKPTPPRRGIVTGRAGKRMNP